MTPAEQEMIFRIFALLVWSCVVFLFGYKFRSWKKPERTMVEVTPLDNGAFRWMTYTVKENKTEEVGA